MRQTIVEYASRFPYYAYLKEIMLYKSQINYKVINSSRMVVELETTYRSKIKHKEQG